MPESFNLLAVPKAFRRKITAVFRNWRNSGNPESRGGECQAAAGNGLYSCLACRSTRLLAPRLVQPSCTVLPLATWPLFTRPLTNQRGRRGAWTRCAPSWGKWLLFGCAALRGGGAGPGAAGGSPGRLGPRDPEPHPGDSSWELGCLGVCFVLVFFFFFSFFF